MPCTFVYVLLFLGKTGEHIKARWHKASLAQTTNVADYCWAPFALSVILWWWYPFHRFLFPFELGYKTFPCSRWALFARPTVVPTQIATIWEGQIITSKGPQSFPPQRPIGHFITILHIEDQETMHTDVLHTAHVKHRQNIHFPDMIERNICCRMVTPCTWFIDISS